MLILKKKPKKKKKKKAGKQPDITNEHEVCGFGYQVVRYDGNPEKPVIYRGEDVVEVFLNHLECEVSNINTIFASPKRLTMTVKNKIDYENTTNCLICKQV